MTKLFVREIASGQGLNLSALQARIIERTGKNIPLGTIRRYWYGTKDGSSAGKPLDMVSLSVLRDIAKALGVSASDLVNDDGLGNIAPANLAQHGKAA